MQHTLYTSAAAKWSPINLSITPCICSIPCIQVLLQSGPLYTCLKPLVYAAYLVYKCCCKVILYILVCNPLYMQHTLYTSAAAKWSFIYLSRIPCIYSITCIQVLLRSGPLYTCLEPPVYTVYLVYKCCCKVVLYILVYNPLYIQYNLYKCYCKVVLYKLIKNPLYNSIPCTSAAAKWSYILV